MPRRSQDASLHIKLTRRAVLNAAKSYGEKLLDNNNNVVEEIRGAGRPIHDNLDYISINIPGDRENVIDRQVTCCDKKLLDPGAMLTPRCSARLGFDDKPMVEECDVHRFFDEYVAFKAGQDLHETGTDLKSWPGIDSATAEDLAYFKVHTVEQLAAMNDSNAGQFHSARQRARDYLAEAKKSAASVDVRAELESRDAQLRSLQAQLAELTAAKAGEKPVKAKGV